jgi:alcohol dehydrogenase class IV
VTVHDFVEHAGLRRLPSHPAALFGRGASGRLAELFDALDTRRCLVVRGNDSYVRCGVAASVDDAGRGRQLRFVQAAPWQTTVAGVSAALETVTEFQPDTVLAIGGGSALDLAKALVNLTPAKPAELASAIADNRVLSRTVRLILVPTTAGSGSELTRFATLWDGARKLSLDAAGLRADVALIDPDLVASAPKAVMVAAAADALCQAVESRWAVAATETSRGWAEQAYRTLLPAVAAGCDRGALEDPVLQEQLMLGASLAGAAIDVSRTTAAHALSYPLTARLGLPHGAAVALYVPWLIGHNHAVTEADCRSPLGVTGLASQVDRLDAEAVELAGTELGVLIVGLLGLASFPTSPAELTLDEQTRSELLQMPESPRMANNPRQVGRAELLDLLGR